MRTVGKKGKPTTNRFIVLRFRKQLLIDFGSRRWELHFLHAIGLLPLTVIFTGSVFISPEQLERGGIPFTLPCLYKMLVGHDCWSCGMTRAFCCITRGRFTEALSYNSFSIVLFVFCVAATGVLLLSWLRFCRNTMMEVPKNE